MTLLPELIVGSARFAPDLLELTEGGAVAHLSGAGLLSVLDARFGGGVSIEIWRAGEQPCAMEVTEIAMQGATTRVTFAATGAVSVN